MQLSNLTRYSNKKYECIADNGVNPSLSRTFTINIFCRSFFFIFFITFYKFIISNIDQITNKIKKKTKKVKPVIKRLEIENHCRSTNLLQNTYLKRSNKNQDQLLIFSCHAQSNPRPKIKWTLNGSDIKANYLTSFQFKYELVEFVSSDFIYISKLYLKVSVSHVKISFFPGFRFLNFFLLNRNNQELYSE